MNAQDFFKTLDNDKPFLKIAFEGFAGSGKTFTSAQLAVGLHRYIKSKKPIAWYDTEKAAKALKKYFQEQKIDVVTRKSRTLADLVAAIDLCEKGAADILVIDSITHVWEAFVESYRHQKKRTFIQFQDWGILKPAWKKDFSDRLVQSNVHIIFTGRAGYEYEHELNEETNKKELVKSGIKMKVENETEYEPDIVVLMEKIKEFKDQQLTLHRRALVLKDRSRLIDGKAFVNPNFENFRPAIEDLLDGELKTDTTIENPDIFKTYEDEYSHKRTAREIALEEIQGILVQIFPSTGAQDKKMKANIIDRLFNTTSWRAVETESLERLQIAVGALKKFKPEAQKYLSNCANEGLCFNERDFMEIFEFSLKSLPKT